MNNAVSPANITAAALMMQILLVLIRFVGITFRKLNEQVPGYNGRYVGAGPHLWMLLSVALVTLGVLVFSEEFAGFWRPLFGDAHFFLIGWSKALLFVLVMDIAFTALVVHETGGSYRSPFTPLCFILPPIAIFLREKEGRIVAYTLFAAILFTFNMFADREDGEPDGQLAYWFVSVASFCLATFIGFITRPR
jgi:hypothetical protein